jgi:hypothetical protein
MVDRGISKILNTENQFKEDKSRMENALQLTLGAMGAELVKVHGQRRHCAKR